MSLMQAIKANTDVAVGMGQAVFARDPARLTTILGSCVAVTMYSPGARAGILGHVVLPQSKGSAGNPAKFADTAVPFMLETLKSQGVATRGLTTKVVGGACMFGNANFTRIGELNVQAVLDALQSAGLCVVAQDVNGASGRRVCFNLASGDVTVACVGCPPKII